MPSEEVQDLLIEALCIKDDDAAIAGVDAALELGADFISGRVEPLWYAVGRTTTRVLEHLFALGASLQAELANKSLGPAMHEAAMIGRVDMLEVLLANGGQELVNSFDGSLYGTPLAFAAHEGQLEAARFLLDHGASIDLLDETRIDDTPLAYAIMRGHLEVARFLVSRGASPDVPGWMHLTPRHRAERAGPEFQRLFEGE